MPAARCRLSPRRAARKVWSVSVTPENEKTQGRLRRRARARRRPSLCDDRLRHCRRPRSRATAPSFGPSASASRSAARRPQRAARSISFRPTTSLYALSDADGQQLWTARGLPQAATLLSNVSPAVSGSVVVAPFPAGDVAAYEVDSGKAAWTRFAVALDRDHGGRHPRRSGPAGDRQGVVFAVSHGGKMIAASESTGERLWTRNIGSTQMPWVAGDTVYVVDLGGKLVALARADGKVRWASDFPRAAAGAARCLPAASSGSCRAMGSWSGPTRGPASSPPRSISTRRSSSRPLWPAGACISWPTTPTLIALN